MNEIWPEAGKTDAPSVPSRRIDDPVARAFRSQLPGKSLASWIGDNRIIMKGRLIRRVPGSQIMKRSEEISDQFGIVRGVVEPPNRFELPRQMKGDFAERCFDLEGAMAGAAILAIEAIAPRPCVRQRALMKE